MRVSERQQRTCTRRHAKSWKSSSAKRGRFGPSLEVIDRGKSFEKQGGSDEAFNLGLRLYQAGKEYKPLEYIKPLTNLRESAYTALSFAGGADDVFTEPLPEENASRKGESLLHKIASRLQNVCRLLIAGGDAWESLVEVFRFLRERGISLKTYFNWTPFHVANYRRQAEVLQLLQGLVRAGPVKEIPEVPDTSTAFAESSYVPTEDFENTAEVKENADESLLDRKEKEIELLLDRLKHAEGQLEERNQEVDTLLQQKIKLLKELVENKYSQSSAAVEKEEEVAHDARHETERALTDAQNRYEVLNQLHAEEKLARIMSEEKEKIETERRVAAESNLAMALYRVHELESKLAELNEREEREVEHSAAAVKSLADLRERAAAIEWKLGMLDSQKNNFEGLDIHTSVSKQRVKELELDEAK